jgi:hypothetical protein
MDSTGDGKGPVREHWDTLGSISNTLEAVLDEDGRSVESVARAAGKDVLNTAPGVVGTIAMGTAIGRGVAEEAAKRMGGATCGLVGAGLELGRLAARPEERTASGVTKAVMKAAVTGFLGFVASPVVAMVAGTAISAAVDWVVDEVAGG